MLHKNTNQIQLLYTAVSQSDTQQYNAGIDVFLILID